MNITRPIESDSFFRGARQRRARRLERYNDDLIGTCPLAPGTHEIRGAGGHYQVTLEIGYLNKDKATTLFFSTFVGDL